MSQTSPNKAPTCFKAYDVRGRIGTDLDEAMAFQIGRAFARVMQPKTVVVGHDCRATSAAFRDAVANGLMAEGVHVKDIGQAGTEEVYFATDHFQADGGIEVTASHNPIDYNGMKLVGSGSRPLTEREFEDIGLEAARELPDAKGVRGTTTAADARDAYATHLVGQIDVDALPACELVVNAGNGVAGAAFDRILDKLSAAGSQVSVTRVHHDPDGTFPNGIPNPLLPENRPATADVIKQEGADLGIAWDGDFDRCFFFDHTGAFVDGEYVVGLLAEAVLRTEPGATIVHDPRVIWNTQDLVHRLGGTAQRSRTGHAHIKRVMRDSNAAYGGEMSAHHYFRDFMYCDSGMLPWLKIIELMGRTGKPLADLVAGMQQQFPSSGEQNFRLTDPPAAIARIERTLRDQADDVHHFDGLSMSFGDWRFNLRSSSTEPVVRLNVETRANPELLAEKTQMLVKILQA